MDTREVSKAGRAAERRDMGRRCWQKEEGGEREKNILCSWKDNGSISREWQHQLCEEYILCLEHTATLAIFVAFRSRTQDGLRETKYLDKRSEQSSMTVTSVSILPLLIYTEFSTHSIVREGRKTFKCNIGIDATQASSYTKMASWSRLLGSGLRAAFLLWCSTRLRPPVCAHGVTSTQRKAIEEAQAEISGRPRP